MWANTVWGLFGFSFTCYLAWLTVGNAVYERWFGRGAILLAVAGAFTLLWPYLWKWIHRGFGNDTAIRPDFSIASALDYIVNDSTAKLKQPAPPKISEFGPTKGHLLIEKGVEHVDALIKLNERLISGEQRIWGLRQMPVTHIPNQFEISRREIGRTYWDQMRLDFVSCFHDTTAIPQTTGIPGRQQDINWTGLMVSEAQVQSIWPRKSISARVRDRLTNKLRITYWDVPTGR